MTEVTEGGELGIMCRQCQKFIAPPAFLGAMAGSRSFSLVHVRSIWRPAPWDEAVAVPACFSVQTPSFAKVSFPTRVLPVSPSLPRACAPTLPRRPPCPGRTCHTVSSDIKVLAGYLGLCSLTPLFLLVTSSPLLACLFFFSHSKGDNKRHRLRSQTRECRKKKIKKSRPSVFSLPSCPHSDLYEYIYPTPPSFTSSPICFYSAKSTLLEPCHPCCKIRVNLG